MTFARKTVRGTIANIETVQDPNFSLFGSLNTITLLDIIGNNHKIYRGFMYGDANLSPNSKIQLTLRNTWGGIYAIRSKNSVQLTLPCLIPAKSDQKYAHIDQLILQ